MADPLIVFALEQEAAEEFADYTCLYTGIGKVQAALALTKQLERQKPACVINLGTAGSKNFKAGTIVNATRFIQRDMDVTALGCAPYETPFSTIPVHLEYGQKIEGLNQVTCGTGDNFSVQENFGDGQYHIVDMEAYALAYICQNYGVPFICLKYISDGADDDAHLDWNESLKTAATAMKQALLNQVLPQITTAG